MRRIALVFMVILAVLGAACGSDGAATTGRKPGEPLHVVTTVSPVTSIAENIGGSKVRITGVVPEGANSHTFEPAPSVAKTLAEADLLVINGLLLEEPTLQLALASMRAGTPVLSLGNRTISREEWQFDFSFPEENGHPNPHLWPDPILALKYAELIRGELSRRRAPSGITSPRIAVAAATSPARACRAACHAASRAALRRGPR